MRITILTLIIASAFVPFAVSAQTADNVIFDLLSSLDGPVVKTTLVATNTPPKVTAPKAPVQTTPTQEVLLPFHLFSVDGNEPKADPAIAGLQATLQALVAQFAALSSVGVATPATTTVATTTETAAPPKNLFTKDLKVGSRGEEVTALQLFLIARGLLFGDATGYFGILTKTAVTTFQSENGLPAVGNVGPMTRAILNLLPPPEERMMSTPPQTVFGTQAVPYISSSTSSTMNATSTGTSTPLFDAYAPPVSVSISILPAEAPVGGSVAVTWLSQNATGCVASDGWEGQKATLGAARIEPLQFSLNFVITCTGPGGVASTSALVIVGAEQ